MRKWLILLLCPAWLQLHAQKVSSDTTTKINEDSVRMAKVFAIATYPLITGSKWSGVVPVDNPTEKPDPKAKYKLLFELTYNNPDSMAKEINLGLAEIGRVINLHVAAGIPAKNIEPAVVVHGAALYSMLKNDAYREKYKTDNPNISFVNELINKANTRFIACGQALAFFDVKREDLLPETKITMSAQIVLSSYQMNGYILYKVNDVK